MAYVNVAEWKPEQVTEWLKGLDNTVFQYVHSFLNNEVNGQQLLNLCPDDLDHLGVQKLGHQEIILEAVEHLRNFHYELDRENLQLLALRLACRARSLHNELKQRSDLQPLSTQTLADVAHVVMAVKPLVCWLDRSPFSGQFSYQECKDDLLHLSLQIATCAQRDRFAEKPVEEIRSSCKKLSELGDEIIQDIVDPLLLQPASLDLVTLKKRASDDLGFFMLPSFHGVHQIAEINFSSPAHQCGKIENGDEIVQVNYQTVVGWQTKKVMALFEESPTEVFLTLKKRPRHTKVYGQIYMKPYRLPSKKRSAPYSRWNDNLPSPRPELLTIPDFEIPLPKGISKQSFPQSHSQFECNIALSKLTTEENKDDDLEDKGERKCEKDEDDDDDDDDDSFLPETADEGQASPTSMRLYLPKPRVTVQRRATVTGASPTSKRPPVNVEQFWAELRLERHWRDCGATENADRGKSDHYQLRDKSASVGNGLSFHFTRPCTTLGIETMVSKISSQQNRTLISNEKLGKTTETVQNTHVEKHSGKDQCALDINDGNHDFNSENNTIRNISFAEKNVLFEGDEILTDSENSTNTLVIYDDSLPVTSPEIVTGSACDVTCFKTLGSDFSAINFPVIDQFSSETENYSEVVLKESLLECNEILNYENENTVNMLQSYCLDNSNKCLEESSDNEYSCEQWLQNSGKERGRLDKSHSTPAYDLLESITFLEKSVRINEDSVTSQFDGVEDERKSTEVNYCTVQSHVELNSFSHVPNILSAQPILCSDDFKSGDVKECGSGLTVAGKLVPCTNKNSEPSSLLLLDEKNNVFTSSQLQNASSENHLLGNKTSHLPVKSIGEKIDLHFVDNTAENASDAQNNLHVNIHSENSCATQDTELPHICLPDVGSDKTFSSTNNIKEISLQSSRISEKFQKSTDCDVGKVSRISPKPDAPKWPVKIIPTSAVGSGLCTRSVPPSNTTKGVPAASFSSPRSTRKRNALLSKRRKVTVKDVGCGDCEGWLLHRFRSSGAGATWLKMWFILKGTIFYGFKTPQATKAHIMIVLPGFTVCVAEEVKSRSFAFKIYHTGTVFYFAAETADELRVWLECLSVAAISQEVVKTLPGFNPQSAYFSETDEDSDCLNNSDSEANVLKNSSCKLGSTGGNNQQLAMKHHQNSRSESKKTDSPKLFGSLKKIVSKTENNGVTVHSNLPEPASSSLDRKYLNFFGGRNINVPVPTAQFRSYRRAPKKLPVIGSEIGGGKSDHISEDVCLLSRNDKLTHPSVNNIVDGQDMPESNLKCHTANNEDSTLMPQEVLLSAKVVMSSNKSDVNIEASKHFTAKSNTDVLAAVESREKAELHFQKHLKVHNSRDRHIHASNPTLQTSSDMLSYRLAAERLRKFGLARNQQEDTSGFVTLEKLMLSHQEEEKHKQEQNNFNRVSSDESTSSSPHQLLDQSQARFVKNSEHTPNNLEISGSTGVLCETKMKNENPAVPVSKKNSTNTHHCSNISQDIRVTLSNKQSSSTLAQNNALPTQKMVSRMEMPTASNWRCANLKAAAQYQPPPISQVLASVRKVHPKEDGPKMKFAFEMHLGENKFSTAPVKDTFSKSSKLRNLFLFTKNQNVKCSPADVPLSSSGEPNKQLTGSPRLHRTFLWEKQVCGSKNSSNKHNNFNSATYPSSSVVPGGWTADLSSPQSDCSISQVKPMMGVAMICKKPCRVVTTASPQSSSAPDYPGLEYPPVFEPETYTLSNASSLFKSRHHHSCSNNKLCHCNTLSNNEA